MRLDFRIDWGYQYLYSRRHYHPRYVWDGCLACEGGEILETRQLDYPVIWFGPGHCAKETVLPSPEWKSVTRRGVAGVRLIAEADGNAVFRLHTASFDGTFTAAEILEKGRIEFPVGPKYLGCSVIVTRTGYFWFRPDAQPGEKVLEADVLDLPVHDWARMRLAWLEPGKSVSFTAEVPVPEKEQAETIVHLCMMAVPEYSEEKETQVAGFVPMTLMADGREILHFRRYLRHHDTFMQMLEDDWQRLPLTPGTHTVTLRNDHESICLGISKITYRQSEHAHGELSVPEWLMPGENAFAKVYAVRPDTVTVSVGGRELSVGCAAGWNEFPVRAEVPGSLKIVSPCDTKEIEIPDAHEEDPPVKVGYDMTVVPHDDTGAMDWLLDYTQRTRLGNYVVFRSFGEDFPEALQERWASFCRDHGIWVSACNTYENGAYFRGAGPMFHDCGEHEYPGCVYGRDPEAPYASEDMQEAARKYVDYLRLGVERAYRGGNCAAFGDASGGIRYSYLAGVDFVRAETMVGHTQVLLSQARPAAELLGNGNWGVHIAIQHNFQPYHENHLGQYFLSLMQPWMMGAEVIYEEDSLFELFKEERQSWDDLLTKGKRDMTRAFHKFVRTHPRAGNNVRSIAFVEGRYAAPFNGFICGSEQDPHYPVWGLFGNEAAEWGHGQPEKCRQVLDVLMPGASTHPLRQKFDKRRFFFSGTPYGDFDCIPAEASEQGMERYGLLLHLGWNTMTGEDWAKLVSYAEQGGTLLIGIPECSTHVRREFLRDMDDLALFRGGDLSGLCGIRVRGKGALYGGQWNCAGREQMPQPELSALPSDSADEDGVPFLADVELCGAETVAWDAESGMPMLVRYRLGKGSVYTFTLWAYPGHEGFRDFTASVVAKLAGENVPDVRVADESGEIFWTRWEDGDTVRLMLLNTDWTEAGNVKHADVVCGGTRYPVSVAERTALCVTVRGGDITAECWHL